MMLTPALRRTLVFIESFQERSGGISPTREEIAEGLGQSSKGSINRLVDTLEKRGFIRRMAGCSRAIEVLRPVSVKRFYSFNTETKKLEPHYVPATAEEDRQAKG